MSFFENFADKVSKKYEDMYYRATGNNFNSDFRKFQMNFEYKENFELLNMWNDYIDNRNIRDYAKAMAIKSIMDKRGIEYDNY